MFRLATMVSFTKGKAMADWIREFGERVERVEQKVDDLAGSVDSRFAEFSAALVEGRQDTEFAFDRLEARFDRLEGRLGAFESRFDRLEGRFGRLERKLDQFIDVQSRTNALVERRLNALESRPPP